MACHCLRRSVLAAGWVERALAVLLTSPNSPGSGDCHTDGGQQLLLAAASRAGSGWPPAADGRAGLCCLCSQPPTPHSRPAGQPLCTRTARHAAPGSPQMSGSSSAFAWPFFYSYPPYFTCAPVCGGRSRQQAVWHDASKQQAAAAAGAALLTHPARARALHAHRVLRPAGASRSKRRQTSRPACGAASSSHTASTSRCEGGGARAAAGTSARAQHCRRCCCRRCPPHAGVRVVAV